MSFSIFVFLLLQYILISQQKTKDEWKSRAIYQVLTDRFSTGNNIRTSDCDLHNYCGGTFYGLQNKLGYIKNLGFDAIWISPVVDNTDGGYHGYWARNINQINSHFGTEQDLKNLVEAAHALDIWVMVDVVANHMGPVNTDYSQLSPFNDQKYFHQYCIIQQNDFLNNQANVEVCRLAGLPDLNQDLQETSDLLTAWIYKLVRTYDFDGVRIDTIPEVNKNFWTKFSTAAGVFTIGEVFDGRIPYVSGYQGAIDATLNYPLYFQLKNIFAYNGQMSDLESFYHQMESFPDQSVLGVFADNHDNARFLNIKNDIIRFKSYVAFSLSAIGIPIFYYGGEQAFNGASDPYNRETMFNSFNQNSELYIFVQKINQARKSAQFWNFPQIQRYSDQLFYAFTRGTSFMAFTNSYQLQQRDITYHPYKDGQKICNIFNQSDCITVQNQKFTISLSNGETKIYILA